MKKIIVIGLVTYVLKFGLTAETIVQGFRA